MVDQRKDSLVNTVAENLVDRLEVTAFSLFICPSTSVIIYGLIDLGSFIPFLSLPPNLVCRMSRRRFLLHYV